MTTAPQRFDPDLVVRSQLFVPGIKPEWMIKALDMDVDVLVLDLEDAVPPQRKREALATVAEFVADKGHLKPCFVRLSSINGTSVVEEISTLVPAGVLGFTLPKTTHPDDLRVIDRIVSWYESEHDVAVGSTWLAPGLETAYAFRFAYDVASASTRVRSASISTPRGGDVERALGFRWDREGRSTAALRSFGALSLRAAGVPNLLAGLWTDVADLDGLRAFAADSRSIGFTGMTVIHPSHLPIVRDVFQPDPAELDYHRRLLDALEHAMSEGRAAVMFEGSMIDIAMIATSRRILDAAGRASTDVVGRAPSTPAQGDKS